LPSAFLEPGFIPVAIGVAMLWGGTVNCYAACAVLIIYMFSKIGFSKGLAGSLNAIKREIALFALAVVISMQGSGVLWGIPGVRQRMLSGVQAAKHNAAGTPDVSGQST